MDAKARAKAAVLPWFRLEEEWGDQDSNFFGYFLTTVNGIPVERPCYLFFADTILFIDAPFCRLDELTDPLDKPTPWGLGRVMGAYTYHNVVNYELLMSNLDASHMLLAVIISQAGLREHEISGVVDFRVNNSEILNDARETLREWTSSYAPLFHVGNGSDEFESCLQYVNANVIKNRAWVTYDDGDGSCYLVPFAQRPTGDGIVLLRLLVSQQPTPSDSDAFKLLTDCDLPCPSCSGEGECEKCSGSRIEWVELFEIDPELPGDLNFLRSLYPF